ncbi:hypothetical protein EJO69_03360 [Flaviflexus salsibiostraticola]|uniref:Pyridoxamine 5'-phosphate oxidase family protein n=1 Tax=Flaviflexus salsibiostraticola TaxID=1282737 RepID=A0A3S8Z7D6_9ACTO|nr:hypothetical protein [Flaviflexus salsibiostraticola]AZN29451.1 hypothetical protein EJO69_03360 [Flaviflexus salsibiostraticola]
MSIPVEPARFARVTKAFASGVLIAHHPEEGIRVLTVDPDFDEQGSAAITGVRGSILDAAAGDSRMTIVWQPTVAHGWTLIYDGRVDPASPRLVAGADETDALVLTPVSGMLHRPSSHADGPEWIWPDR